MRREKETMEDNKILKNFKLLFNIELAKRLFSVILFVPIFTFSLYQGGSLLFLLFIFFFLIILNELVNLFNLLLRIGLINKKENSMEKFLIRKKELKSS